MTASENDVITRLGRLEHSAVQADRQRETLFTQNSEMKALLIKIDGKMDGQIEKVARLEAVQAHQDGRIDKVETHVDRMKFLGGIGKVLIGLLGVSGIGSIIAWFAGRSHGAPLGGGD